jgi:hypothetical protein
MCVFVGEVLQTVFQTGLHSPTVLKCLEQKTFYLHAVHAWSDFVTSVHNTETITTRIWAALAMLTVA